MFKFFGPHLSSILSGLSVFLLVGILMTPKAFSTTNDFPTMNTEKCFDHQTNIDNAGEIGIGFVVRLDDKAIVDELTEYVTGILGYEPDPFDAVDFFTYVDIVDEYQVVLYRDGCQISNFPYPKSVINKFLDAKRISYKIGE